MAPPKDQNDDIDEIDDEADDEAPAAVVVPTAAPKPTAPTVDLSTLHGVKYVGGADRRRISVSDLKRAGDRDPRGDLLWSKANNFVVAKEEMNPATINYLLSQPGFKAV